LHLCGIELRGFAAFLMLVKKYFYLTHLTVSSLFSSLGVLKAVENVNKVIGPALIGKVSRGYVDVLLTSRLRCSKVLSLCKSSYERQ